jgi:hypothetical protein
LFGTLGGVFTPTLLTIPGVIMYLREGWVVGNAGLLGATFSSALSSIVGAPRILQALAKLARRPTGTCRVSAGGNENPEGEKPRVTLFSMNGDLDRDNVDAEVENAGTPCIFALDSGTENAFAQPFILTGPEPVFRI